MKTKDIATQYSLNKDELEIYIRMSNLPYSSTTFGGMVVDDGNVSALVTKYKQYLEAESEKKAAQEKAVAEKKAAHEKAESEKKAAQEKAAAEKNAALAKMLITSGFNFDGYTITKYSGYISGDDAVEIDRGTSGFFSRATNVADGLMSALVTIRRNALAELKEAAYALGCNAVIGVDFDYLTLDPETANSSGGTTYLPYVFGVTADGNAVIIEKNKTSDEV
jgi:uncharacterized protein YbjQ (UPF0145 family)